MAQFRLHAIPAHSVGAIWRLYVVEGMVSLACNLLGLGVFFYTEKRLGWTLTENFLLAAGMGAIYVAGALASDKLTRRLPRRRLLTVLYLLMGVTAGAALVFPSGAVLAGLLLLFTLLAATSWPALESLISSGVDAHAMSRRLGVYNLVWSALGAVAIAVNGTIIDHFPPGVFLVPASVLVASGLLMLTDRMDEPPAGAASHEIAMSDDERAALAGQRTLALWLSRLALPATYVIIFSLGALMPHVPSLQGMTTSAKTAISSIWMVSRMVAFAALAGMVFWHTRPRLLLLAAVLMFVSFPGVALLPLGSMVLSQIALGAAMGIIYTGSLYFGMVLSNGSTEHGGYHEALIGLGCVVGPASGLLAQWLFPVSPHAPALAITVVAGLSCAACGLASITARKR
jgi:MFS family permease